MNTQTLLPEGSLIQLTHGIPNELPREYTDQFRYDRFAAFLESQAQPFQESPLIRSITEKMHWNDEKGMYAFVSWRWVNPFVNWIAGRGVLEVMARAGWLAKALRLKGVDIIATDTLKWQKRGGWSSQTHIENKSAHVAIHKYGAKRDILIISWPYMDISAFHAIRTYYKVNPKGIVVYIGESEGGCTADETFFKHFKEKEDPDFFAVSGAFQAWDCMNDRISLGRFTPEAILP